MTYDDFMEEVATELTYRNSKKVANKQLYTDEWDTKFVTGECPVCGDILIDAWKYCPQCGQMIDWRDVDE